MRTSRAMAYGFATHLWILGTPEPLTLRAWLLAAAPDAREGDVVALRLGERTLLAAVNKNEREARWRSIGLVTSVAQHVRGFEWVSLHLYPDHDLWRIERQDGEVLSWDPNTLPEPEGAEPPEPPRPGAELMERARSVIRSLVPLELHELHHYIDWGHELEDTPDGALAPSLEGDSVRRFALGLPLAPVPSRVARAVRSPAFWLLVLCLLASGFTVSVVQPPGPGAFLVRFIHFILEAFVFWSMAVGAGVDGGSKRKVWLTGCAAIVVAGAVWGLVPV
ncbi:hypothetical protein KYC5002_47390 [Archangium violaceum]|uniref:hypothetical protein n=1 Tax=Archangium violaceum TaxID=83451 RepID=UPI002B30A000|nr:hypothetical protein KYC5002_47390 [Archangium gephyra]